MADDPYMMTAEELRLRRRKRRRIGLFLLLILILIVGGFFAARPARHAIKAWQARRHANKALDLIDKGKWQDAKDEAVSAYQLWPNEPEGIRAIARFLSRTRQPQALEFWSRLEKIRPLTSQDRRDEAAAALTAGEMSRAEAAVHALLKSPHPEPADWLLDAQLGAQSGAANESLAALDKIFDDPKATEQQQFQAAVMERLLAPGTANEKERVEKAWSRLEKLAGGKTDVALKALLVLAQQILTQPNNAGALPFKMSAEQVRQAIESHPLAKTPERLMALDLKLAADPGRKEEVVQEAINDWKDADTPSLAVLAMWLNGKGEFQKTLDITPLNKAQNEDTFLQHLDALGALDRWEDIRQLLESEKYPLDQTKQHMYLARCYAKLGQEKASEHSWQRAMEAAGGDPAKLLTVANYAEKNGITDIAEKSFETAATQAPQFRPAWQGRLRIAQGQRNTGKMHEILVEMLKLWPNDSAVLNDEAYTRLLLLSSNKRNDEARMSNSETNADHAGSVSTSRSSTSSPTTGAAQRNDETSASAQGSGSAGEVSGLGGTTEHGTTGNATGADAEHPIEEARRTENGEQKTEQPNNEDRLTNNSLSSNTAELREIERVARKLVEREPASLPHRTLLALARLKQNRPEAAMEVYKDILVPAHAASSSALAVNAAVFAANGQVPAARERAQAIPRQSLLPEEQGLIEQLGK